LLMITPPPIEVANLGMWDTLILMVMALVVVGPRKLPELGRQIGKLMYEVRKASNDFKFQMEEELRKSEEADRQKKEAERQAALALAAPALGSQLPEVSVEAPAPTFENPYPEGAVYPAILPEEFPRDEPYPRIQPPSTGEPVAADQPGRMAERGEIPAEAPASVTEQAHHG